MQIGLLNIKINILKNLERGNCKMRNFYEIGIKDCLNHNFFGYSLKRFKRISEREKNDYVKGFKETEYEIICKIYMNLHSIL